MVQRERSLNTLVVDTTTVDRQLAVTRRGRQFGKEELVGGAGRVKADVKVYLVLPQVGLQTQLPCLGALGLQIGVGIVRGGRR